MEDISVTFGVQESVPSGSVQLPPEPLPFPSSLGGSTSDDTGDDPTQLVVDNCYDFLEFGSDLAGFCSTDGVKEPGKRRKQTDHKHALAVIQSLKKQEPFEATPSSSRVVRKYVRHFDGVLDDAECDEIDACLAAYDSDTAQPAIHNTSTASSSTALGPTEPGEPTVPASLKQYFVSPLSFDFLSLLHVRILPLIYDFI